MELDDFKNIGTTGEKPEMGDEKSIKENMETFIDELKANDTKERKQIISFILIIVLFIAIYSESFAIQKTALKPGYALLILGFVLILFFMFHRFFRNRKVDYTVPTKVFLLQAEHRYKFMNLVDWIITVPLLALLVTGGALIVHASFMRYFPGSAFPLIIYLILMTGAIIFGYWASRKNWIRDKKRMFEEIRKLKEDFNPHSQ